MTGRNEEDREVDQAPRISAPPSVMRRAVLCRVLSVLISEFGSDNFDERQVERREDQTHSEELHFLFHADGRDIEIFIR